VDHSLLGLLRWKADLSLMSTKKKRVLFITSSLNLGGAERQLLLLCQGLNPQVDVQIVSLDSEGPLKEKYLQAFPDTFFLTEKNLLRQINRLKRTIRISKPDVVITWLYRADLLGGIAAKLARNIPVIWSARNSSIPHLSTTRRIILGGLSKVIPSRIVANGLPAYNFHISLRYPAKRMLLISNLLAPWVLSTKSGSRLLRKDLAYDSLRIGIAARQVSGKGILEIIEIIKLIPAEFPKIDLLLIGEHSAESRDWEQEGLYNGNEVLTLHLDSELAEWFASLDLYVMSSTCWESQPNSLIEAIAIGCPVLVSNQIVLDLPIPPQLRFDPTSQSSFQNALNRILRMDSLEVAALTDSIRKQTLATLSDEVVVTNWISLIKKFHIKE
jgi:glycosyltransferase involved in cell wall biosynthesis